MRPTPQDSVKHSFMSSFRARSMTVRTNRAQPCSIIQQESDDLDLLENCVHCEDKEQEMPTSCALIQFA
jgi:hypothetical protein